MNDVTALAVLVVLLLGNGFFVAAEFAMVSARRDALEPTAADGSTRARWSLRGLENVSASLAATQLGVTACSLLIGAVGEPAIAHLVAAPLEWLHAPESLVHPVALAISLLVVTFLHMVLGEMVPKNMAISRPAGAALALGPVLRVFVLVFRPVIWLMNHTANAVVRHVCRAEPRDEADSAFTVDQMRGMIASSGEEGLLDADEQALITGALTFDDVTAADVSKPLAESTTVSSDITVGELQALCASTHYSRFPVRMGSEDEGGELVGYVHVKDTLADPPGEPLPPARVRRLGALAPADPLDDVLERMQSARAHLALVEGEHGEPEGLVSLEDVLQRLVGEIRGVTPELLDTTAGPAGGAAAR